MPQHHLHAATGSNATVPVRQTRSLTCILSAAVTVRKKKGVSLETIADRTKISIRTLRAIEEGDFKKLPGGIYNTSYIKQYARAIDFDEQELLACYYEATGITPPAGEATRQKDSGKGLDTLREPSTVTGS